MRIKAFIFLEV